MVERQAELSKNHLNHSRGDAAVSVRALTCVRRCAAGASRARRGPPQPDHSEGGAAHAQPPGPLPGAGRRGQHDVLRGGQAAACGTHRARAERGRSSLLHAGERCGDWVWQSPSLAAWTRNCCQVATTRLPWRCWRRTCNSRQAGKACSSRPGINVKAAFSGQASRTWRAGRLLEGMALCRLHGGQPVGAGAGCAALQRQRTECCACWHPCSHAIAGP